MKKKVLFVTKKVKILIEMIIEIIDTKITFAISDLFKKSILCPKNYINLSFERNYSQF